MKFTIQFNWPESDSSNPQQQVGWIRYTPTRPQGSRDYFYTADPARANLFRDEFTAEFHKMKYLKKFGPSGEYPEGYTEDDLEIISEKELEVYKIMFI